MNKFEVRSRSPLDNEWETRDEQIEAAAGRTSDWSGAGSGSEPRSGERDHGWIVGTFDEAVLMKKKLESVQGVSVIIKEEETHQAGSEEEHSNIKETHDMQLCAIMTVSKMNTEASAGHRLGREHQFWTAAYEDVCVALDREIFERKRAEKSEALSNRLKFIIAVLIPIAFLCLMLAGC